MFFREKKLPYETSSCPYSVRQVGWLVGLSNFPKNPGSYTSMLSSEHLLNGETALHSTSSLTNSGVRSGRQSTRIRLNLILTCGNFFFLSYCILFPEFIQNPYFLFIFSLLCPSGWHSDAIVLSLVLYLMVNVLLRLVEDHTATLFKNI